MERASKLSPMSIAAINSLPADFEHKLTNRLAMVHPGTSRGELRRHVEATVEFLSWCTIADAPPLAPCPAVDVVWHEMIMFTADYRALCRQIGAGFIDHEPIEHPDPKGPSALRTLAFARRHGRVPRHPDLWAYSGAAKCCGGHVAA